MRDATYYVEDIEFPLPGTRIRTRSQLVLYAFASALVVVLFPGVLILVTLSKMPIVAKVFGLFLWGFGELTLVLALWRWIYPRLKSSLPIVIAEDWIQMPVTLFERIVFQRRLTVFRAEIESIRVVGSSYWDSKDTLALIVTTKGGRTYRSSAKNPQKMDEIVRVLSRVWPDIRVETME